MIAALVLAAACANEIELFCKGLRGARLEECLAEYADSATLGCREALAARAVRAPKGKQAEVWSSPASASGPSVSAALTVVVSVAENAQASGFELAIDDEPSEYAVTGKTPGEILASMGGSGITDGIDGSKGAASTGGSLSAQYSRQAGSSGCALTAARLRMKITQRLPKWDEPHDAAAQTKEWWAKLLGVIKLHEDGHKKIDIESARDALSYLQHLGSWSTCAELDAAAASELHRANTEGTQQNVAYDQQTHHGQTQYEATFGR